MHITFVCNPETGARGAPLHGYCHCGCGRRTSLAPCSDKTKGWIKGQPVRYVQGHSGCRTPNPKREIRWLEEDRGYATPCWVWQLSTDANGYGRTRRKGNGQMTAAHRIYYEEARGPIPDGLTLDHLCRVRACVNPAHLEPVTQAVNVQRGLHATLTREEAGEVRGLCDGGWFQDDIAAAYGISQQSVSDIKHRRTWVGV